MNHRQQPSAARRPPRAWWWIALALAIVAAAVAAYYFRATRAPQPPAPTDAVTLAVPMHPTGLLTFIALDRRYFAVRGLAVTLQQYPSGKRALEDGLLQGRADVAWSNEVPVAFAALKRSDFRIAATTTVADDVNRVIARRDRGIAAPKDLRGKRIATQKGSAVHFFLHLFLLEHGLTDSDVQLSFLPAEELAGALASGAIDAFAMREPFIGQAAEMLGRNAVVFGAPGVYEQMEIMLISRQALDRKPRLCGKLLAAMLDAEAYAAAHPRDAAAIAARRLGIGPAEAEALLMSLKAQVSLPQSLLVLLESEARWAIRAGLVAAAEVPNYLTLIHAEGLKHLRPESVTLIE